MDSSSAAASSPDLLVGEDDCYGGFIIDPLRLPANPATFLRAIQNSLAHWKSQEKFCYHHAERDYVMLTHWIFESDSTLPANASHRVGVGGIVINDQNEAKNNIFALARDFQEQMVKPKFVEALDVRQEFSLRSKRMKRTSMNAEGSQRWKKGRERAKKAFEHLKVVSVVMGTPDDSRLPRWANPRHMQWKEINDTVTTSMVKDVWPCSDSEISKGRWKISKCLNEEIKQNAETIAMEVFGQPLRNHDAPLYFAKMLYMHYVRGQLVDFSSKEATASIVDQTSSVTLSREELQLALEGAQLDLMQQKELLQKRLFDKEQEVQRILQAAIPPP